MPPVLACPSGAPVVARVTRIVPSPSLDGAVASFLAAIPRYSRRVAVDVAIEGVGIALNVLDCLDAMAERGT